MKRLKTAPVQRQRQHSRFARRLVLAGVFAVALAVAAGLGVASRLGAFAPSATASRSQHAAVQVNDPGTPAIHPTLPGSVPAFTEADVLAYYHVSGIGVPFTSPGGIAPNRIVSIQFISADAAATSLRTDIGMVAPDHLVCLVQLTGKYTLQGFPVPNLGPSAPTPDTAHRYFTHANTVYDAVTGNLLVTGVTP
jgi:hypothetical protein